MSSSTSTARGGEQARRVPQRSTSSIREVAMQDTSTCLGPRNVYSPTIHSTRIWPRASREFHFFYYHERKRNQPKSGSRTARQCGAAGGLLSSGRLSGFHPFHTHACARPVDTACSTRLSGRDTKQRAHSTLFSRPLPLWARRRLAAPSYSSQPPRVQYTINTLASTPHTRNHNSSTQAVPC